MTGASRSLFVFGIYLVALGVLLLLSPNLLLRTLGVPVTNEIWIRDLGIERGELTPLRPPSQIALCELPQRIARLYRHTADCSKGTARGRPR